MSALTIDAKINDDVDVGRNLSALSRSPVENTTPNVLSDIYREDTNIVIWQRNLSNELTDAVNDFLQTNTTRATVLVVTPENTHDVLKDTFGESDTLTTLGNDITLLVDMFCCLFDLKQAGLRLTILDRAMCPRFHVDRIPCRLVTTYQGIATEWLNHAVVDRTKLGAGNQGKADEQSGLFNNLKDINRLDEGDVALLKGEHWDETEGGGLVHRSPPVSAGERRLLLTLDFISD
ncbi:MAG: DUF1826 domain-containing protein [Cognaticolwellia sp.]|jgi:hypothetical protein